MDPGHRLPIPAPRKKYEVFISFRGKDTRRNFALYLHKELLQANIETYIDYRIERGDELWQALEDAIEDSQYSIVIFSPEYASSSWCLKELVHILHCRDSKDQTVIPVFYNVESSDLRWEGGRYAEALVELKQWFDDETIKIWKDALTTASYLAGHVASNTKDDGELIKTIVTDILKKLNHTAPSSDHLKGLVGMEKRIKDIESLLLINSSTDVRIVGIWGMGGLGKTTLARIVFQRFYFKDGSCFLENVREEWQKHGSVFLKNNLFAQLAKEKNLHMLNDRDLKDRLYRKKLLIILDDVDDKEQFKDLVGDRDLLKPGSRIVITTRNKQVLRNIGVDEIYALQKLNKDEALKLFYLNAFKTSCIPESYMELSRKVLNYAKGVPLVIEILGSHLCSRSKEEWESALEDIDLDPKIQKALEISFHGLDDKQKAIFLDIACFFKGMRRDHAEDILGSGSKFAITNLIDKTLITETEENTIWMHDLVEEMGLRIANGTGRLWSTDEICHVFETNKDTESVKGIFLDEYEIEKDINLKAAAFKGMHKVRLLKLSVSKCCQLHLPEGLQFLPDNLVYFQWDHYPLSYLPSNFRPFNLVELHMPSSQLEKLWDGVQDLRQLKYVNLENSKKLTRIPDFSRANLKIINLEGCSGLVDLSSLKFQQVAPTEKSLVSLSDILSYRYNCSESILEPYYLSITNQYLLDCQRLLNLKTVSNMFGYIEHIRLGHTAVEELHSSVWSVHGLVSIDLNNCKHLKSLPSNICEFKSLEYLDLGGCSSFDNFPAELPKSLKGLNLCRTAIKEVPPSSFECLPNLKFLNMSSCRELKTLPATICMLESLEYLHLGNCYSFNKLPAELPKSLIELNLSGTDIEQLHSSSFECLHRLECLNMNFCTRLETLPTSIYKLKSLWRLYLSDCSKLMESFSELVEPMECLEVLNLKGIRIKKLPWSLGTKSKLLSVFLARCFHNFDFSGACHSCIGNCLHFEYLHKKMRHKSSLTVFLDEIEVDLTYSSILSIPDWYDRRLSSLELVADQNTGLTNTPDKITMVFQISQYGEHKWFRICKCETASPYNTNGYFYFSHYSDEHPYRPIHTNFRWISCCQCSNYDQECEALMKEFLIKILCMETASTQDYPRSIFCYNGNRIPRWFSDRSVGSSIEIDFSPHDRHNTSFLGFAFCIVFKKNRDTFLVDDLHHRMRFRCKYRFTETDNGNSPEHGSVWYEKQIQMATRVTILGTSDHVFIHYSKDYRGYRNATKATFEFYLEVVECKRRDFGNYREEKCFDNCTVEKCGVRILYGHDVDESIKEEDVQPAIFEPLNYRIGRAIFLGVKIVRKRTLYFFHLLLFLLFFPLVFLVDLWSKKAKQLIGALPNWDEYRLRRTVLFRILLVVVTFVGLWLFFSFSNSGLLCF